MAKESKQDRIARQMMEHIAELKAMDSNANVKESDVEKWAQTFLKSCLGYTVTNNFMIKTQETKGKHRPDIVVYKNDKPIFVMEVKKLGFDFEKSDFRNGKVQLKEYLSNFEDVQYGFLCNGYEWKLYDFSNKQCPIEIQKISFKNDGVLCDTSKRQVEEMCYDFTCFHESAFAADEWADLAKEATAFSPDSLAKAILSSGVMKIITKEIRGEHEFKASSDLLYEKVYHLLSCGLDDTMKEAFNVEKKAEFEKYIKGQMRQARKAKKTVKVASEAPVKTDAEVPGEALVAQVKVEAA